MIESMYSHATLENQIVNCYSLPRIVFFVEQLFEPRYLLLALLPQPQQANDRESVRPIADDRFEEA